MAHKTRVELMPLIRKKTRHYLESLQQFRKNSSFKWPTVEKVTLRPEIPSSNGSGVIGSLRDIRESEGSLHPARGCSWARPCSRLNGRPAAGRHGSVGPGGYRAPAALVIGRRLRDCCLHHDCCLLGCCRHCCLLGCCRHCCPMRLFVASPA